MMPSFWQDKTVLLTGHTGFKGSWMSLWLEQLGANVIGYGLPPISNPNLFSLARIDQGMTHIEADVRDLEQVLDVMRRYHPDIVIHMAAQPLVRLSYQKPVETYATNIMGTVHVLEAVRQCASVQVVLNITSDKCYENREWQRGYKESDPMGGHDPYSSSKGCAELVTAAYRCSFFSAHGLLKVASARAGNVIGGGDWSQDRLIPDIIKAFTRDEPAYIRHPQAVRPWQHVLEALGGYLLLVEKLWDEGHALAQAWNFGPDTQDARAVSWVVDYLAKRWGSKASWEMDIQPHPHEATLLSLDSSKARKTLNWMPCLSLEETLDWVVDWYKAFARGEDMRAMSLQQIEAYQQKRTVGNREFAVR